MSACPDCEAAAVRPWHGYRTGCDDCQARRIARGPLFWQAGQLRRVVPAYRAQLEAVFGDDWLAGHERVKEAA